MTINDFSSPLAEYFRDFIALKHALGYKYESELYHLRMLDKVCAEYSDSSISLTKETVEAWVAQRLNESIRTQGQRISLINGFSEVLTQRGVPAHVMPTRRRSFHSQQLMFRTSLHMNR